MDKVFVIQYTMSEYGQLHSSGVEDLFFESEESAQKYIDEELSKIDYKYETDHFVMELGRYGK